AVVTALVVRNSDATSLAGATIPRTDMSPIEPTTSDEPSEESAAAGVQPRLASASDGPTSTRLAGVSEASSSAASTNDTSCPIWVNATPTRAAVSNQGCDPGGR